MKHAMMSSNTAHELAAISWHEAPNGVTLSNDEGHVLGVLLHPEEYQILRAVAEMMNEPEELMEMLKDTEDTNDDSLAMEEIFRELA